MQNRLTFDVFGKRMQVELCANGWRLFLLGADGKRSPLEASIPVFVTENELEQFLGDLFHENATSRHPYVRRLPAG